MITWKGYLNERLSDIDVDLHILKPLNRYARIFYNQTGVFAFAWKHEASSFVSTLGSFRVKRNH